jgi:hypothetical protein
VLARDSCLVKRICCLMASLYAASEYARPNALNEDVHLVVLVVERLLLLAAVVAATAVAIGAVEVAGAKGRCGRFGVLEELGAVRGGVLRSIVAVAAAVAAVAARRRARRLGRVRRRRGVTAVGGRRGVGGARGAARRRGGAARGTEEVGALPVLDGRDCTSRLSCGDARGRGGLTLTLLLRAKHGGRARGRREQQRGAFEAMHNS